MDESLYWGRSGKQATVIELKCVLARDLDVEALKNALLNSLKVHTNFRTRPLFAKHRFWSMTDDVKEPPMFKENGRPRRLGTNETNGLMLYVSYKVRSFTLHVFHGIADLRSISAFLNTLLKFYYYPSASEQIVLPAPDSSDTFGCYEEILKNGAPAKTNNRYAPKKHDIFHIPEKSYGEKTTKQRVFEIDLPLKPFLAFTKENKSSVVPTLNAVIGHAIHQQYNVGNKDITCYVPVDLRPVFHFESGGNAPAAFTLPYSRKMEDLSLGKRAMYLRNIMKTQTKPESLYKYVADLKKKFDIVYSLRLPVGLLSKLVVKIGREIDRRSYTYGISYGGKVSFGEGIYPHVVSISAAAGSYSYPLWIIACEYNGVIRMKFIQSYESDKLVKAIYGDLAERFPGTRLRDQDHHMFDEFHIKCIPHRR
ncbi:MAG: hypothetical protein K6B74_03905 [Ruminococcus sp.]|nr:hypothetical protein [Ruminococcus sp.]